MSEESGKQKIADPRVIPGMKKTSDKFFSKQIYNKDNMFPQYRTIDIRELHNKYMANLLNSIGVNAKYELEKNPLDGCLYVQANDNFNVIVDGDYAYVIALCPIWDDERIKSVIGRLSEQKLTLDGKRVDVLSLEGYKDFPLRIALNVGTDEMKEGLLGGHTRMSMIKLKIKKTDEITYMNFEELNAFNDKIDKAKTVEEMSESTHHPKKEYRLLSNFLSLYDIYECIGSIFKPDPIISAIAVNRGKFNNHIGNENTPFASLGSEDVLFDLQSKIDLIQEASLKISEEVFIDEMLEKET